MLVYSCKKNARDPDLSLPDNVKQVKAWYGKTFLSSESNSAQLASGGSSSKRDISKIIKPDWKNAANYFRGGKDVYEIPVADSAVNFNVSQTAPVIGANSNKRYSRSSFIILNDGKNYTAYVMTILADSAYLGDDFTKLANNTYKHRDKNFSGSVLYFTPTGSFVSGWHYLNGKVDKTMGLSTQSNSIPKTQSINGPKILGTGCSIITLYIFQDAITIGGVTYYDFDELTITSCDNDETHQSGLDDDGGFTQPGGGGGTTATTTTNLTLTIITDSLKRHFPCATKLILDSLLKNLDYAALVQGFNTPHLPDLSFRDSTLGWNTTINGVPNMYVYGVTSTGTSAAGHNNSSSSTITLNTNMLQSSSMLLIAATVIHESLHGVVNYNEVWGGIHIGDGDSWMNGINSWFLVQGLPTNFVDHYAMMDYYFDQAVAILAKWDNNQHAVKEYQMAMLNGLNNPGVNNGSDPNYAMQAQMLQNEFSNLKTKYSIADTTLSNFLGKQTNAATAAKLPTGCN